MLSPFQCHHTNTTPNILRELKYDWYSFLHGTYSIQKA